MKATADELLLFEKLTTEPLDPTVTSRLFDKYYLLLINGLSRRFQKVDIDLIHDVAFDTLDKFAGAAQAYDPQRGTLVAYLKIDAQGNMRNSLAKQGRENKLIDFVEDWEGQRNIMVEAVPTDDQEQVLKLAYDKLREIFPHSQDLELAKMMLGGVRETSSYAKIVGADGEDFKEQQAIVKRHKDRITQVLNRSEWSAFRDSIKQRFL